jgi:hypothetical protein
MVLLCSLGLRAIISTWLQNERSSFIQPEDTIWFANASPDPICTGFMFYLNSRAISEPLLRENRKFSRNIDWMKRISELANVLMNFEISPGKSSMKFRALTDRFGLKFCSDRFHLNLHHSLLLYKILLSESENDRPGPDYRV